MKDEDSQHAERGETPAGPARPLRAGRREAEGFQPTTAVGQRRCGGAGATTTIGAQEESGDANGRGDIMRTRWHSGRRSRQGRRQPRDLSAPIRSDVLGRAIEVVYDAKHGGLLMRGYRVGGVDRVSTCDHSAVRGGCRLGAPQLVCGACQVRLSEYRVVRLLGEK
jgi:hypothetical protein